MGSCNKLVVFLCLAVLATSTQARSPRTLSEAKLGDIFDDADALLKNLTQIVFDQGQKALTKLNDFYDQIHGTSSNLLSELFTSTHELVNPMIDNLNDKIKDAKDKGLDPADCVGSSLTDLNGLPSIEYTKTIKCLSLIESDADDANKKIFLETTSALQHSLSSIDHKIKKCRKKSSSVQPTCIAKVTAEIEHEMVSLPKKISSAVTELSEIVSKDVPKLVKCKEVGVDGVRTSGNEIVQNVTDCINKLKI